MAEFECVGSSDLLGSAVAVGSLEEVLDAERSSVGETERDSLAVLEADLERSTEMEGVLSDLEIVAL